VVQRGGVQSRQGREQAVGRADLLLGDPLRVVGTCRHFATLACAILRARGVAARARCGFGTYFVEGRGLDHWITEYWHTAEARWVRRPAHRHTRRHLRR
jgi:transglutaminase-like putative cysteine protease